MISDDDKIVATLVEVTGLFKASGDSQGFTFNGRIALFRYLSVTLFWGILLGEANIFPKPGTSDGTHCSDVSSKDQTIVSIIV